MPRCLLVILTLLCIQSAACAQGIVGSPQDVYICGPSLREHPGLDGPPIDPRFGSGVEVWWLADPDYDRSVEICRAVTAVVAVITLLLCRWRIRLYQAKVFQSARQGSCIAVLGTKSKNELAFWYGVAVAIPVAIYVAGMSMLQPSWL